MTTSPEEVSGADPARADPALRGAPPMVRKASAWLEEQKPHKLRRQMAWWSTMGLFLSAFPAAGVVATLAHSEPVGLGAMLGMIGLSGLFMYANWRSWGRTTEWAEKLIHRWKQLEELGIPADLAPEGEPATGALDRMLGRIEALAGPGREGIKEAAARAVERARRLEGELVHLDKVATGQPDADAAIEAARERIHTELARTRARVAEVYAALVDLEAGRDDEANEALEQALARVAAELEVERPTRLPREPLPTGSAGGLTGAGKAEEPVGGATRR